MRAHKRIWLYGGLVHPLGIVVARPRPKRRRLPPGARLLVAGDDHAWGLSPFLRELCRDDGVSYDEELDAGATIERWATDARLSTAIGRCRPHMVVLSLDSPTPEGAPLGAVASVARGHGATLVWVRPLGDIEHVRALRARLDADKIPSFHSEALELPRGADGQPTVRGYAGWAGALWRWLGS